MSTEQDLEKEYEREFEKKLIGAVKRQPCLYAKNHPHYENKVQNDIAWLRISKSIRRSLAECINKWYSLLETFFYLSNADFNDLQIEKWPHYKAIKEMQPYMVNKYIDLVMNLKYDGKFHSTVTKTQQEALLDEIELNSKDLMSVDTNKYKRQEIWSKIAHKLNAAEIGLTIPVIRWQKVWWDIKQSAALRIQLEKKGINVDKGNFLAEDMRVLKICGISPTVENWNKAALESHVEFEVVTDQLQCTFSEDLVEEKDAPICDVCSETPSSIACNITNWSSTAKEMIPVPCRTKKNIWLCLICRLSLKQKASVAWKACRFCGQDGEKLKQILSSSIQGARETFSRVTGHTFSTSDGLPCFACEYCLDQLFRFAKFYKRFTIAQTILKEIHDKYFIGNTPQDKPLKKLAHKTSKKPRKSKENWTSEDEGPQKTASSQESLTVTKTDRRQSKRISSQAKVSPIKEHRRQQEAASVLEGMTKKPNQTTGRKLRVRLSKNIYSSQAKSFTACKNKRRDGQQSSLLQQEAVPSQKSSAASKRSSKRVRSSQSKTAVLWKDKAQQDTALSLQSTSEKTGSVSNDQRKDKRQQDASMAKDSSSAVEATSKRQGKDKKKQKSSSTEQILKATPLNVSIAQDKKPKELPINHNKLTPICDPKSPHIHVAPWATCIPISTETFTNTSRIENVSNLNVCPPTEAFNLLEPQMSPSESNPTEEDESTADRSQEAKQNQKCFNLIQESAVTSPIISESQQTFPHSTLPFKNYAICPLLQKLWGRTALEVTVSPIGNCQRKSSSSTQQMKDACQEKNTQAATQSLPKDLIVQEVTNEPPPRRLTIHNLSPSKRSDNEVIVIPDDTSSITVDLGSAIAPVDPLQIHQISVDTNKTKEMDSSDDCVEIISPPVLIDYAIKKSYKRKSIDDVKQLPPPKKKKHTKTDQDDTNELDPLVFLQEAILLEAEIAMTETQSTCETKEIDLSDDGVEIISPPVLIDYAINKAYKDSKTP